MASNGIKKFSAKENMMRGIFILVLSVLGYAFMLIGKIPGLQICNILEIDISDIFVVAAYTIYGFPAAVFVACFKSGLLFVTFFNQYHGGVPIELIANLLFSFMFVLSFFVVDKTFQNSKNKIVVRAFSYLYIIAFVSLFMTIIDYLFLVPTYLNDSKYITYYAIDLSSYLENKTFFFIDDNYTKSVFTLFVIFNDIKCLIICLIYEFSLRLVIRNYLKSGFFENRYFMKKEELVQAKYSSLLEKSNHTLLKNTSFEKHKEIIKKHNARKAQLPQTTKKQNKIITDYLYNLTIDDYGSIHTVSILTISESASLIINYMKNAHPASEYHITNYKITGEKIRDYSTDGLSQELFEQVNHCTKQITKIIEVGIKIKN